uniref:Wsv134-like protein n=1 Tax=Trachysalambria curvirostris majanivirus TaxID=2984281 RepID=A0A9C7BQW5_9VIRU|nr:MAG: wsv134-like protein [Trachysalambria curvirostris majanivirus]
MKWIEKCKLVGRLYQIAKEELMKPFGNTQLSMKNKLNSFSASPQKQNRLCILKEKRRKTCNKSKKIKQKEHTSTQIKMAQMEKIERETNGHLLVPVNAYKNLQKGSIDIKIKEKIKKRNYDNSILDMYVKQMYCLKDMGPPNEFDIKICLYDQWNATVRCDMYNFYMVLIGGILGIYEPEMGITLKRACQNKRPIRVFNSSNNCWNRRCYHSFSSIEKTFEKRPDVSEIKLPLSRLNYNNNINDIIDYLLGKKDHSTKIISIWDQNYQNRPPIIPIEYTI